jgi:excisionase family DNA binding protein
METDTRQSDETMWDVDDVARYLKIKEATVRAYVLNDSIPFHKVGRLVRFRRSEIDVWVEQQRGGDA